MSVWHPMWGDFSVAPTSLENQRVVIQRLIRERGAAVPAARTPSR